MGGNSLERDISIITANQVLNNIDTTKYKVYPLMLDHGFYYIRNPNDIQTYIKKDNKDFIKAVISNKKLYLLKRNKFAQEADIDCAMLCTHGGNGENGSLQGLLEIEDIPYTSPSLQASCICMHKNLTKKFLKNLGVPYLKSISLKYNEQVENICKDIEYPIIVKPNSLGSSIGISVVNNKEEFLNALKVAFMLDEEIIIEKELKNFREINIACYMKDNSVVLSQIEETKGVNKFFSFEEKYMNNNDNLSKVIPAEIEDYLANKIRAYTEKVYLKLGGKGLVRFDYLLEGGTKLYLNEINTIPGSMAFYLFKDISFKELITQQIEESIKINKRQKRECEYKSNVLEHYAINNKNLKISKFAK